MTAYLKSDYLDFQFWFAMIRVLLLLEGLLLLVIVIDCFVLYNKLRGHHGHDHMVVGFTTTYAFSAYQH
jgi:L-asparagine transporter-like permease